MGGEGKVKYRFYHEWIYQFAKAITNCHIKCSEFHTRRTYVYLGIMKKMYNREKAAELK